MSAALSPMRAGRITGSRVAAVLGISPWASPDDVLREMVRQALGAPDEFVSNSAVEYGNEHELDGIYEWETRTGVPLAATGDYQEFVTHPEIEYLGVTPDGRAPDGVVEVKAPLWGSYGHWRDVPWYEAQIRLAIECADAQWGDLAVWRPEGTIISRIERDPWWMEDQMPVLEQFHALYETTMADPAQYAQFLKPLVDVRVDAEWIEAAERYREVLALESIAGDALKAARDALIELAGDEPKVKGHGVSVSRSERVGAVDWKRLKADHAPDVDESGYRKASTTVTTVRVSAARDDAPDK